MAIGILAFGSLLEEPGQELRHRIVECIEGIETPFAVEFARSSFTRDGGPTLVPERRGAAVCAGILVLDDELDEETARNLLYRRETHQVDEPGSGRGRRIEWIRTLSNVYGLGACLYTALEANIQPLTSARLAELAVKSARAAAGVTRKDGISYLEAQKRRGVMTPLMPAYEAEVLRRTGGHDLADAWARVAEIRR